MSGLCAKLYDQIYKQYWTVDKLDKLKNLYYSIEDDEDNNEMAGYIKITLRNSLLAEVATFLMIQLINTKVYRSPRCQLLQGEILKTINPHVSTEEHYSTMGKGYQR